jgi:ATP-binding cassette subfamily A (ABC1) protein 3
VQIRDLRKVYSGGKVAVEGLTLDLYEDHITALLGHNGAGKSTTISMLTGLIRPSSGDALIWGHSIRQDMNNIRRFELISPFFPFAPLG